MKKILVTGATGKVGSAFIATIRERPDFQLRALCHNRLLTGDAQLEVVQGSIADRDDVRRAMDGVTHVVHLATCKETPQAVMDVTVKGLFWLLEECRSSSDFEQFVLIGGDASIGHFFYPHPNPVTEAQKHSAYPGCYALSKVLEETMLEQYFVQYDLNGCCLRAPWIMEKDDFRFSLSFGEDVFGGPRWADLVPAEALAGYQENQTIPVMLDPGGNPVQRNFVHVNDLVAAIVAVIDQPRAARQQLFNICMDEPLDYRVVAEHLSETRGLPSVDVPTPYHSTWLDNAKAKFLLGWRPEVDARQLADLAWDYQRAPEDVRTVYYPG
ncbi:MAG: NAD-dependent epimerase/dehydratase family protein [Verrucomicrobiales bacterium]